MTIVLSGIFSSEPPIISMTVDSAEKQIFSDETKYREGKKLFEFEGIGCVSTWGARDGNRVADFLRQQELSPDNHTIIDLAQLVEKYLVYDYKPKENNKDEVGYHVAGFDTGGKPHLFHVFYGFNRPKQPNETTPDYHSHEIAIQPGQGRLLYNGRNDLVNKVLSTIQDEIDTGGDIIYRYNNPITLTWLSDFIVRFASEITFEVGPPFLTALISPRNQVSVFRNDCLQPIERRLVLEHLIRLGYEIKGSSTPHDNTIRRIAGKLRQLSRTAIILTNYVDELATKIHVGEKTITPDICWSDYDDRQLFHIDGFGWKGAPKLVVEVLAPCNRLKDLRDNFQNYEECGIKEYWLVDILEKYIQVWSLDNSKFRLVGTYGIGDEMFVSNTLSCAVHAETIEYILGIN
jgi:Uma2 family endonuclease